MDPLSDAVIEPNGNGVKAGDLLCAANRVVHALRKEGLEAEDSVACLLANGIEILELTLACTQAGWRLVPINSRLQGREVAEIVRHSGAKVFVGSARYRRTCSEAAASLNDVRLFSVGQVPGFRPYSAWKDEFPTDTPADRQAGLVMTYTSGTTGRPKGVRRPSMVSTDPDLLASLYTWFMALFDIEPGNNHTQLVVSPLFHTGVLNFAMNSLHMGHQLVLMDRWSPRGMLDRVTRYRATITHMVPAQFQWLLALPEAVRTASDHSSLRHVVHSAAPCPVDIKRRMLEWWGPVIFEYYAAAEGGGTLVKPEEWLQKPGTVGRPWPISEIQVMNERREICPPGVEGTVWIRMGGYRFEYDHDPQGTAATWNGDFFTVGDIGFLDEDGYLFLCDRRDDVIIVSGVNVYPAEVEAALLAHHAVVDAAVVGVPDSIWGERVKAVVVISSKATASPTLGEEILNFCRRRIAHYKSPRTVDFVERIPRDPTGKLLRRELRDAHWAGRTRST